MRRGSAVADRVYTFVRPKIRSRNVIREIDYRHFDDASRLRLSVNYCEKKTMKKSTKLKLIIRVYYQIS